MKQVLAGVSILIAVVVGFVLFPSLGSPAQEEDGSGATTTTTAAVPDEEAPFRGRFGFGGVLPPELDEFLSCLAEQGIALPDGPDRDFLFDLPSADFEGLTEALEACGLSALGGEFLDRVPEGFGEGFPGPEGFPFHHGFDFDDEFFHGFPERFGDGFRGGERFEFHGPIDRDELAECLFELGSFDSVEAVRDGLDECLPERHFDFDFDFGGPGDEPAEENSTA